MLLGIAIYENILSILLSKAVEWSESSSILIFTMSRSSHGDDSDRTSESSELVIDKNNGLKEEAPTRTLPLLQPKIRRHQPNPPTLFPIQVDPYCNGLRSTTRYEMNDNSCAIEPPLDLLRKHEHRVLPTKMSPHFLRTLTLRSNDSNEIITDTKQDAPSGYDDVKLIAQDLDIFNPYLSEPSEIYGDLCRVSFELSLSPDDGDTKKPASSITNQQFVYSSPSHTARHHLPYPAPRQRQNSSRSLFDTSNDPPVSSITIKPQNNSEQTVYSSLSHIARHHLPYPAPRQRQNSSRSLFDMSNDPLDLAPYVGCRRVVFLPNRRFQSCRRHKKMLCRLECLNDTTFDDMSGNSRHVGNFLIVV